MSIVSNAIHTQYSYALSLAMCNCCKRSSVTHFIVWCFDRLRSAVKNMNRLMYWLQVSSTGAGISAVMFRQWQNLLSVKTLEFSKPSKKALIVQTRRHYLMHRTYKSGVSYHVIFLSPLANLVIFLAFYLNLSITCRCFALDSLEYKSLRL